MLAVARVAAWAEHCGERDHGLRLLVSQSADKSLAGLGCLPGRPFGPLGPSRDAGDLALGLEDHPCVWTDGGREPVVLGLPVRVFIFLREYKLSRCRAFMPVPGPLQTVRSADFWGAILALQAFCHDLLCNDNPVIRAVG